MNEKIESALSAEEWARAEIDHDGSALRIVEGILVNEAWGQPVDRPAAVIALANVVLSDSDPRKITREKIAIFRYALDLLPRADGEDLAEYELAEAFADALESYLPPVVSISKPTA